MNLIRTIALTLILAGCTEIPHKPNNTLYREFQEYKNLIDTNHDEALETKISKSYLNETIEAEKRIPAEFKFNTSFWEDLAKKFSIEHSHFEKIKDDTGCLTINGLDNLDRIKSLSVYYIQENQNWVINGLMITAHESIKDYYTKPECPSREDLVSE